MFHHHLIIYIIFLLYDLFCSANDLTIFTFDFTYCFLSTIIMLVSITLWLSPFINQIYHCISCLINWLSHLLLLPFTILFKILIKIINKCLNGIWISHNPILTLKNSFIQLQNIQLFQRLRSSQLTLYDSKYLVDLYPMVFHCLSIYNQ